MGGRKHPQRKTQRRGAPQTRGSRKDTHESTLHKLFGTGRRLAATLGTILVTAFAGWAVGYYAPGIASSGTEAPPIVTDVQDDPFAVDAFSNLPVRMFLPANAVSPGTKNPPADYCNGFHGWGRSLGGADLGTTYVRIIVQGMTDSAVIITGLSAHVLGRKAIHGLKVECPTQGQAQIRFLTIDLDSANPSAHYLVEGRRSPFGFTLAKNETEVFDVTATTSSPEMIDWDLLLNLTVDGKEQVIEVQDRGKPFRTIADNGVGLVYDWTGYWEAGGARKSPFQRLST